MRTSHAFAPIFCLAVAIQVSPCRALAQESTPPVSPEQGESSAGGSTSASSDQEGAASKEGAETGEKRGEDEETKRKLSDRIKSVQRKAFIKKNRIEVFPQFAFDLNDAIIKHFIVGAAISYHFADSAALELRGGYVFATQRQSIVRFIRQTNAAILKNPFEAKYNADIDFLWAPIYGKISLFSEAILHFDTYLTAGPGVFGTDTGAGPAMNVGIGQRYFITDWLTARIELRDYIFMYNQAANNESTLENLLVLGFAVSGFFPTEFQYQYQ